MQQRLSSHLRLYVEGSLSSHCNLLFHDIEVVETTDEKASAVDTQVEVNIITCKSEKKKVTAGQRNVLHHTLINTNIQSP